VEHRHGDAGKGRGHGVEVGRQRPGLEVLRLLDEGIDDERLPPGGDLVADEGQRLRPFGFGAQQGFHFCPPRGHLGDGGDIQIAVERERQRPWDRGGGHHQVVGALPLGPQPEALADAEPVLLVHHDQSQRAKGHRVLQKGVGPHHEGDAPVAQARKDPAALGRRRPRGEEADRVAGTGKEGGEAREVLFGQDGRGGHIGRLVAALDGGDGGDGGDDGLAASHVAVEEAPHGAARGHVVGDGPHRLPLPPGQLERQNVPHPRPQGVGEVHPGPGGRQVPLPPVQQKGQFVGEQFVEDEAPPPRLVRLHRLGAVEVPQGPLQGREPLRRRQVRRQGVGQGGGAEVQHLADEEADLARVEGAEGGIDRHHPPRLAARGGGQLPPGALQHPLPPGRQFPVQEQVHPLLEDIQEPPLVEKDHRDEPRLVGDEQFEDEEVPAAGLVPVHGGDAPADGVPLSGGGKRGDGDHRPAVLVPEGEVAEEVPPRSATGLRKRRGANRTHALEEPEGKEGAWGRHGSPVSWRR